MSGFNNEPGLKPVNSPFIASLDRVGAVGLGGEAGASGKTESLLSPRLELSLKLVEDARGEGPGLPSLLPGAFPKGL